MTCRRLRSPVIFEGIGLHSGQNCKVTLSPSENLLSINNIPVCKLSCEGTARGSDLIFPDGGRVRTVEHLLAAVSGLGLWNTDIEVEGVEIPAIDGCAETFARVLHELSEPCACVDVLSVCSPVSFENGRGASIIALPSENFQITYIIEYENPLISAQIFEYRDDVDFFVNEISRARTFALERDIKLLRENGMALGGTLDNAILVCDDEIKTSGGLRYKNEFVRHKILDLIGDLALVGRPLNAHIIAIRAGHAPHLALVEKLRRL